MYMMHLCSCYAHLPSLGVVCMHFDPSWSVVTSDAQCAQIGCTALIFAAENGHADCVRLLLDAGADTNAQNIVRLSVIIVCVRGRVLWNGFDELFASVRKGTY